MAQFEIKNLSFSYPNTGGALSLSGISLEIEKGDYVCILGKSGSGKTTLLENLKPTLTPIGERKGSVIYDGEEIGKIDRRREASEIGYVMQNPDDQIVTDKVWHELAFGLESLGEDQKTIRLRVAEMASYFGIQDWFERDVATLSGGQKQLLNLASIMAMRPEVLILDEPTSQLDPIAATDFLNTVRKINLELGTTVIITEHRLSDILPACDKAVVMDGGRIIAFGSPKEIGRKLYEEKSDMFLAMPVSMRLFYEMGGEGESPITVRSGRTFLDKMLEGREIAENEITEDETDASNYEAAIEIREAWFRYEKNSKDILKGLNLRAPKGKLLAIVGGNGTGKTTALRAMAGLITPYRGKVKIFGKNLTKYGNGELFDKNLAMLPQDPLSLFVKKTVKEELLEMTDDENKINEIAKICDIEKIFAAHPYDISGGEQQRVALGKVLLAEPKILLLDEPTKGMDNFFKERFAEILKKLTEEGKTIVMVSHDTEFAARHADLVGLFFNGEIITMNTPRKFFSESSFYTTSASRMTRHVFKNAITLEDILELCRKNLRK